MQRRSNILVAVGIAAIIIGAVVVYLITTDGDNGTGSVVNGADTVEVVVAKSDLVSGTLGDDVLSKNEYELRRVRTSDKQPDALTAASQLSNQILTASFPEGEQLRTSGLRPRSLLSQQGVTVPAGFEAVAVNVDFVASGAGYIAPGDKVNVYMTVTDTNGSAQPLSEGTEVVPLPYNTPRVELLLTNISVLDVSQQVAPNLAQATTSDPTAPQPSRSSGSALNVLLSVSTLDAEKVIYASTVGGNSIYLTRVNADAVPAGPTSGQDAWSVLAEEAVDAFTRTQP